MQGGEQHDFGWRAKGRQTLRLGDYLEFARERLVSAELDLRFGVIELGRVLLVNGELRHAELPGSEGTRALALLSSLPRIEAEARSLTGGGPRTFHGDWRSSIRTSPLTEAARRALSSTFSGLFSARIAPIAPRVMKERSPPLRIPELKIGGAIPPLVQSPPLSLPAQPAEDPSVKAAPKADFDALFVQAMRAYGRRDYRSALEVFDQCADLRPDDSRVQHNRLRLRKRLGMP